MCLSARMMVVAAKVPTTCSAGPSRGMAAPRNACEAAARGQNKLGMFNPRVACHTGMLFTSDVSWAFAPASHVAAAAPNRDKNRMVNGNSQEKEGQRSVSIVSIQGNSCHDLELRKPNRANTPNGQHDGMANFCILSLSYTTHITTQHVFPRRFICRFRRQPDSGHQAASRTRSRRRQRKTARRGTQRSQLQLFQTTFARTRR